MISRTRRAAAVAVAVAMLASSPALGQSQADLEQAKTLFTAGAQAYANGRHEDAVKAFEDAYRLAPRPSVLFSYAQAEKKLYFAQKRNDMARRALEHYRKYLAEVPASGRRNDAIDAIAELEPIVQRLDPQSTQVAQPDAPRRARLYVSSSAEPAQVLIDDKPAGPAPFVGEVEPGRHRIKVTAEGYFDVEKDIRSDLGVPNTVEANMPERPAPLTIAVDSSCDIYVDGKLVGTAPFARPVDVPPGAHTVAAVRNGSRLQTVDVLLERGKPQTVKLSLQRSPQRTFSYFVVGSGAVVTVIGALVGVGSLSEQGRAIDLRNQREDKNVEPARLAEYNAAVNRRDNLRTASLVTMASGVGVMGIGAVLYVFDKPDVTFVPRGTDEKRPQPKKHDVELGAAPALGPDVAGAVLFGHF